MAIKNSSTELEKLSGHAYDGIEELDNPLPKWWVYLFYITIVFSVLYAGYYFVFGPTLREEWEDRMSKRMTPVPGGHDALAPQGLAALAGDPQVLSAGKTVYIGKCAACHAPDGGGLIGPNLTDMYWIHGKGALADIVLVVQKGVPEKGMLAWEALLSESDLVAVSAYVKSLQGTTPVTPKAPQGALVQ